MQIIIPLVQRPGQHAVPLPVSDGALAGKQAGHAGDKTRGPGT
ncbi:MAG: hypothetical protein V3R80_12660 [Candidatus Tectomicrobia bacterium]